MLLDACLVYICVQWLLQDLVGHHAYHGHPNAIPAVLHSVLTASCKLQHGVPHALRGLTDQVLLLSVRGRDNIKHILEVNARQVPRPPRHPQPGIGIMQCLALDCLPHCLLLVVGCARFDLGGDLLMMRGGRRGLVGLGVARSDVHEVRVLAGQKHLLPSDHLI
jgi:hypothetical protein